MPRVSHYTTAMLRSDIDSGRTGDKVAGFDPAVAPLGTDDEAAGTPPGRQRVNLAQELKWPGLKANVPQLDGPTRFYIAFVIALALLFLLCGLLLAGRR